MYIFVSSVHISIYVLYTYIIYVYYLCPLYLCRLGSWTLREASKVEMPLPRKTSGRASTTLRWPQAPAPPHVPQAQHVGLDVYSI